MVFSFWNCKTFNLSKLHLHRDLNKLAGSAKILLTLLYIYIHTLYLISGSLGYTHSVAAERKAEPHEHIQTHKLRL